MNIVWCGLVNLPFGSLNHSGGVMFDSPSGCLLTLMVNLTGKYESQSFGITAGTCQLDDNIHHRI